MHTILLVEDNLDHVELTLRAIRKVELPVEVFVAHDGAEALAYLSVCKQHEMPCFTLLDLDLPGIDGLEVLKRIREDQHTHYLPVVILTTSQEKNDELQGYDLGANSYVCKPVDYSLFLDCIKKLGEYWLSLNQSPYCID